MSSYYGILLPEYFDGRTGKEIARIGRANALLLGCYLTANRRANMIGLYRLPLDEIKLPLSRAQLLRAFEVLDHTEFAHYDDATEFVWVREMARIRVGLRTRDASLNADDNRVDGVNRLYQQVDDNPFLGAFYERYRKTLHLKKQRTSEHHPYISPLERGYEGPSKPVQRSGSDNRDQDQRSETDQGRARARARAETRTAPNAETIRTQALIRLAHTIADEHPEWGEGEIRSEARQRAEKSHIAYNYDVIADAVGVAMAQRKTQAV